VRCEQKLDQIEARNRSTSLTYSDLSTEAGCQRVFEECLPFKHDQAWWLAMDALNLQTNTTGVLRYYRAYQTQLDRLSNALARDVVRSMNIKMMMRPKAARVLGMWG
jgi:hypothetical protein